MVPMAVPRSSFSLPISLSLLLLLTGCSSEAIERAFSADPNANRWGNTTGQVPPEFPQELRYPQAQLQTISPKQHQGNQETRQVTRWGTADASAQVQKFYRDLFQGKDWQLLNQQSTQTQAVLTARTKTLQVTVAVNKASASSPTVAGVPLTTFQVDYGKTPSTVSKPVSKTPSPSPTLKGTPSAVPQKPSAITSFDDLDQVPPELQSYVRDLAKLEVLTPNATPNDDLGNPTTLFEPNQLVTRGTFARWLVEANNRIYRDRATQQIRLAATTTTPAFQDLPASDPLFPYIQGLADAGYLPSKLTGDSKETTFKSKQPLTRETLLTWKVPLDLRQILPTATASKVQQVWGFKDANRVSPQATAAVLADHKNGELANIRRLVGSALLFQPQKPVTRAEAAATLWFIGKEGEGFSAKDVVRAERQATNSASE